MEQTDISILVFQLEKGEKLKSLVSYSDRQFTNTVSINTLIQPGSYLVLPLSFHHFGQNGNSQYTITFH